MEELKVGRRVLTLDGGYLGVVSRVNKNSFWVRAADHLRTKLPKSLFFDADRESVTLLFTGREIATYGLAYLATYGIESPSSSAAG